MQFGKTGGDERRGLLGWAARAGIPEPHHQSIARQTSIADVTLDANRTLENI